MNNMWQYLVEGLSYITTKESSILKCIQAVSLRSISYKMVPLSEQ